MTSIDLSCALKQLVKDEIMIKVSSGTESSPSAVVKMPYQQLYLTSFALQGQQISLCYERKDSPLKCQLHDLTQLLLQLAELQT